MASMDHFIHDYLSCVPRFLDYDEGVTEYLRPESSKSLNPLDPGLRRDDVVSGKYAFMGGH